MSELAHKPYSSHPDDQHLRIVLHHLPHNAITPYVTWILNTTDGGKSSGCYFEKYSDALKSFIERGRT